MKGTITLIAVIFFSFFSIQQAEAGVRRDRVVVKKTVVVTKPVATGYWKWSPRLRRYVWVKGVRVKRVRPVRTVTYTY